MKIAILEIAFCISQGIYTPEKKKIEYNKFLFVAKENYCLDFDYNLRSYKKNLIVYRILHYFRTSPMSLLTIWLKILITIATSHK